MEALFSDKTYRDILPRILQSIDRYVDVFNLRSVNKYLSVIAKEVCFKIKNGRLHINNKPFGWDKRRTKFITEDYIEISVLGPLFRVNEYEVFSRKFSNIDEIYFNLNNGLLKIDNLSYKFEERINSRSVSLGRNYKDIYVWFRNQYLVFSYAYMTKIHKIIGIYSCNGLLLEFNGTDINCYGLELDQKKKAVLIKLFILEDIDRLSTLIFSILSN